jgi:N-acetyl-anhydromuramyl-L-alanine amidase AmpD
MAPFPPYIFGIHDSGGEALMLDARKPGWIVISTRAIDPAGDYTALTNSGLGVIVCLNYGYGSDGTIPPPSQTDYFARQCAQHVAASQGAQIWVIGNEANSALERPNNSGADDGLIITPDLYAQCFAKCRASILSLPDHSSDLIAPAPPGLWLAQSSYATNPLGDWIKYYQDVLNLLVQMGCPPTALALHTYTHGFDAGLVANDDRMGPGFPNNHLHFRSYRDCLAVVPPSLRSLPVFITETQPVEPGWWQNRNIGWIRAAYAEIDSWNSTPGNQAIQALCLSRWQQGDLRRSISDKPALLEDFRQAIVHDYISWMPPSPAPSRIQTESVKPPAQLPQSPQQPSPTGWCPFAVKRVITANNYDIGRDGHKVKAVVMHIAAGPLTAVFPTFNNSQRLASAHFCIGKDGTIEQYVSIDDVAYAVGLRHKNGQWYNSRGIMCKPSWQDLEPPDNPNLYTISVEHEGQPEDQWTKEMVAANTRLLRWIARQCGLNYVPRRTLIGHFEIDPVDRPNCPGPNVEWEQIAADANATIPGLPGTRPTPGEIMNAMQAAASETLLLPINTEAAIYRYAQDHDLGCPLSGEIPFVIGADGFLVQVFLSGVAYAKQGDWDNVHSMPRSEPLAAPSGDPVWAAAISAAVQVAWLAIDSDSEMARFAREHDLGCPQSDEFDFTLDDDYVGQVYLNGFVYTLKDERDNIQWMKKTG